MKNLEVAKCYACHKLTMFSLMKPIFENVPEDDGIVKKKKYICLECYNHLKKFKFVKQKEVKEAKEVKERIKKYKEE